MRYPAKAGNTPKDLLVVLSVPGLGFRFLGYVLGVYHLG